MCKSNDSFNSKLCLARAKNVFVFKMWSVLVHAWKHATPITVKSPHLNERMPVGDRFSGTCEHFTPVVSTEAVCIVANSTHTNDLIMAYAVGAEGGREEKNVITTTMRSKNNDVLHLECENSNSNC